jgi:ABC-type multidrug transport system fused ATPase/permease subunit
MALGCTLIVVAHRMAATRRARRVLVMDGAGIDVGSHEELLARHALYADFHGLWRQA